MQLVGILAKGIPRLEDQHHDSLDVRPSVYGHHMGPLGSKGEEYWRSLPRLSPSPCANYYGTLAQSQYRFGLAKSRGERPMLDGSLAVWSARNPASVTWYTVRLRAAYYVSRQSEQ